MPCGIAYRWAGLDGKIHETEQIGLNKVRSGGRVSENLKTLKMRSSASEEVRGAQVFRQERPYFHANAHPMEMWGPLKALMLTPFSLGCPR